MKGGGEVEVVILALTEPKERYELSLVDFVELEKEDGLESIVGHIHNIALKELTSRTLGSMWSWEVGTKRMFEYNKLEKVRDITALSIGAVNRLTGCGYKTRKEIYDVFCMYHLRLKHWSPELHYSKQNYKF